MSTYLQGVCSSPPYLSKRIWCPVVEASKRSVCFPVDACSLFIQIGALVWLWAIWEKQTSCFVLLPEMSPHGDHCFDVCVFQSVTEPGHKSNKKHFNSPKSSANLLSPSFRWQGLQLSVEEPLQLQLARASLSNVTTNPQRALITVTPSGRKEYIFMLQ